MNECLTTPQHEKQIGYWVSEKGISRKNDVNGDDKDDDDGDDIVDNSGIIKHLKIKKKEKDIDDNNKDDDDDR